MITANSTNCSFSSTIPGKWNSTEIFEKLDIFWARLAMHIRAEHLHLFPVTLKALESKDDPDYKAAAKAIDQLHEITISL